MPSAAHQTFIALLRSHPEIVFELARRAGIGVSDHHDRFEEVTPEFDDPLEAGGSVRADLALVGYLGDRPVEALVVEVQLGDDPDKEWTLVLYRAALRRRLRRPAWVLVLSPEPGVRESLLRRYFRAEPELRPAVVSPTAVPVIADLDPTSYPWAVLAAAMHPTGPDAALAALVAIRAVLAAAPPDQGRYIQLVASSVGEEVMKEVRAQLPPEELEPLTEWERRGSSFTRGRAEGMEQGLQKGIEQGLQKGIEQGLQKGIEQGLQAALRMILEARGLTLDPAQAERVHGVADVELLQRWITRAATVPTAAALLDDTP